MFPNGYKERPCEVYKRLSIIPQTFLVTEHHVYVYASKNKDSTIVKVDRPADVFKDGIATPPLFAAIITRKYLNHLPLQRQSKYYKENGIKLEPNTMANLMIKATDIHLSILYDEQHETSNQWRGIVSSDWRLRRTLIIIYKESIDSVRVMSVLK